MTRRRKLVLWPALAATAATAGAGAIAVVGSCTGRRARATAPALAILDPEPTPAPNLVGSGSPSTPEPEPTTTLPQQDGHGAAGEPQTGSVPPHETPVLSGETSGSATWYDAGTRTVASRDYPRGTRLRVSHAGRSVDVTVADYGPEAWTGHQLDLSEDAFAQLAPVSAGVIDVSWVVLG